MSKLKEYLCIMGGCILLIGACYLMMGDLFFSGTEKAQKQIMSYLEKKYDKKFIVISVKGKEFQDNNDVNLFVYPEGGDEEKDRFTATRKGSKGDYTFEDNYFGLLIKEEYEEKVHEIAKEFFPECKVDASFAGKCFPNEFNSKSSLQDVIDEGEDISSIMRIFVAPTYSSADDFDENVDLFIEKMIDNKLPTSVGIFYLNNDNLEIDFNGKFKYQELREILIRRNLTVWEGNEDGRTNN